MLRGSRIAGAGNHLSRVDLAAVAGGCEEGIKLVAESALTLVDQWKVLGLGVSGGSRRNGRCRHTQRSASL